MRGPFDRAVRARLSVPQERAVIGEQLVRRVAAFYAKRASVPTDPADFPDDVPAVIYLFIVETENGQGFLTLQREQGQFEPVVAFSEAYAHVIWQGSIIGNPVFAEPGPPIALRRYVLDEEIASIRRDPDAARPDPTKAGG